MAHIRSNEKPKTVLGWCVSGRIYSRWQRNRPEKLGISGDINKTPELRNIVLCSIDGRHMHGRRKPSFPSVLQLDSGSTDGVPPDQ